jgi:hypothetical protein
MNVRKTGRLATMDQQVGNDEQAENLMLYDPEELEL